RRKVMPSIFGISISRIMTSGSSSCRRRAAANGSEAVAITSISGSSIRMVVRIWRTEAESSTIITRSLAFPISLLRPLDLEDRRLDLPQARHDAVHHRFRVSDHQIAAGPQMRAQLIDDLALGFLLEIDQDIPAEDQIDVAIDRIVAVHQVHAHEIGLPAQF